MTQVNFCKVSGKEYLARFLILTMMMFMSISFISQKNAFKVAAVTTESGSGSGAGGDINDLDVSKIEEYIERFPHEEHIYETLQREVF